MQEYTRESFVETWYITAATTALQLPGRVAWVVLRLQGR